MSSLGLQVERPKAQGVVVTDDSLVVELTDGRTVSAPLVWYPRLMHGSPTERGNWRFTGAGEGIHWPKLDEDLSVESIIAGRPSGESAQSLRRWLYARRKHDTPSAREPRILQSRVKRARRK